MPETLTREGSAPLSEKGRRTKRPNRRKRAKQWTFLIEKLKLAVDGLYEMCREEQNLNGCKEALMYLQNSSRDFESLIASIHVEMEWEEKEKPQAVAWEIRKSMSSPAPVAMKDASAIMNQITPLMFSEVVKAASDRKKVAAAAPATAAAAAATTALQQSPEEKKQDAEEADESAKDEWQVVLRGRRKKSLSSMTSESRDDLDTIEHTDSARPSNVYERLASSGKRYQPPTMTGRGLISASSSAQSSNYMCPKSAMDLPQTKASMAKMAYSRQLLWQRSQSTLIEKMKARQVRTRNADFNSASAGGGGGGQRPRVPSAEGERRQGVGAGKAKSPSDGASDTSRNLTSIRETQEDEKGEIIPLDPKPSTREEEGKEAPHSSRLQPPQQQHSRQLQPTAASEGCAPSLRSLDEDCLSFPLSNPELLNLEGDREWREMTEEEESLAFEERSLNIEIEQEKSLSIDAELERQVAAEADELEREEEQQRAREEAEAEAEMDEEEEVVEEEEEPPKLTPEELAIHYNRWRDELLAELATANWSEMVERDLAAATTTNLREPGDAALRHERMMSPSRKKEELSEADLCLRHEQKQKRADELRERLKEEKAARLKALLQKVEEVREKRAALIERKRALMENRLRTANANRERNLEEIVRKAREDEMKVMEAQLIHTLEKGNMRMDQQKKEQRNESRRQEMKEERVKKHEEKAAKDAAVEERRRMNDTRSECSARSICDEAHASEEEQRVETPPVRVEEEGENLDKALTGQPAEEKADKVVEVKEEEERKGAKEGQMEEVKLEKGEKNEEEKENGVVVEVSEERREKKRKSSKEKRKEKEEKLAETRKEEVRKAEEEVKKEEERVEVEYDWKEAIDNWTTGASMLTDDGTRAYRCGRCEIELRSEWEAVAHVLEGGHAREEEMVKEGEVKIDGGSRRDRLISALSSSMRVTVRRQEPERKESASAKGKRRKTKRGEAARAKESAEALARAIGGGHGPSVDLWREILLAADARVMGDDEIREVTLFGKRNGARKKAGEAVAGFVDEYAKDGGGGDAVMATVLDAVLRAATGDRSIRESGKEREDKEAREIEDAAWCVLRCLARDKETSFTRLIAPATRCLRLTTVLLRRVDASGAERKALKRVTVAGGRVGGAAAAAGGGSLMTTMQPVVFELLQRMGVAGGEGVESVLCLLEAPRRLATLPIAHLIQPPNRHIMLAALIGLTRSSQEALRDLQQHLSPWHIVQFLKSEINRPKCICPLHAVLPTKESIADAIQYYERAIP